MKILVIAPHADDAEFGAGGTISLAVEEGHSVIVKVMCLAEKVTGDNRRWDEGNNSLNYLGVKDVEYCFSPEWHREFNRYRQKILDMFISWNELHKPDMVVIPQSGDIHQDHKVVYEEGIRAFRESTLLGYDMPSCNFVCNGRYFVQLGKMHIDNKFRALQFYESVRNRPYMQEEYIYGLAKIRGVQCGCQYAEAFEAIRVIERSIRALGGNGGSEEVRVCVK